LTWARGRLVAASRAAGLGAPMMSVYTHVKDGEGLRRSCASALLAAMEDAGTVEGGVIVLPDGRMVDPAMIGRAREIVALMQQIETHQS
jgi:citrate lyase subunit beta/citryl-CoA lyase